MGDLVDDLDVDLDDLSSGGIDASTIQVGGVVRDAQGHEWLVPADETEDLGDLKVNPFGELTLDPAFHYQTCRIDEVSAKLSEGFVLVTRDEVGLPSIKNLEREFGMAESTYVRLHDGVLIKLPKILADRKQAKKARLAQAVVDSTEPTEEMLARARRSNSPLMRSAAEIEDKLKQKGPFEKRLERRVSSSLTR
jgi:hypothetical protein